MYRCEATSTSGFVQQFACCYVLHGYHYYVVGQVPKGKDPGAVDAKLIERFGLGVSRFVRARRKKAGLPNVQYIRYGRFFVICSTGPKSLRDADPDDPFFESEFVLSHPPKKVFSDDGRCKSVRQIRFIPENPLSFAGYSIGWHRGRDRKWHVSVRIHPERYKNLKAYLTDIATKRSVESLVAEFQALRFEPYAPVRSQLMSLRRRVNEARKKQGYAPVPFEALRMKREIVKPFGFEKVEAKGPDSTVEKAA